jgi:ribonuclease BN (tRNA processing enzyme)
MELVVLGTGTVAPSRDRTAPAYWITAGSVRLLLDCGAGALHRAAAFDIPWYSVTHVALTHFHPDHWGELPMLLFALRYGIEPARSAPLALIGPAGLRTRLTLLAGALGDWVLDPGYPCDVREVEPGATVTLAGDVVLETCKTPHTQESLAYAVRDGASRLVYTGDTGPSETLAAWARGCDLLLAECSLPEERALDIHLTPAQAGSLARAAHAGRLVLTHFYPPVEGTDPAGQAARRFDGSVVAARDGERFTVGGPQMSDRGC